MNTLLRAGLGGALLALATACSGDVDAGSEGLDGELEDQGSETLDVSESADTSGMEPRGVIEKANFNDNLTLNGFRVNCLAGQKTRINEAEARAAQILAIALPATADARINRTTVKGGVFRSSFCPNAPTNPDPNRTSPDECDVAASRVAQKLLKVQQVLASAFHTCHGEDESVRFVRGAFLTCRQSGVSAATEFVGGADNPVRWCDNGLGAEVGPRAVTLLHELTHQDRTVDARGIPAGRVIDDDSTGRLNNAQNYSRWLNNNQPR